MEIVKDADNKVGGKYLNGAVVTIKAKEGTTANNVKANGVALAAEDGVYTVTFGYDDVNVTAFDDNVGARLEGYSLSIQEDGDIGVNFYMSLDDSIASYSNAKMRFVIPTDSRNRSNIKTKTIYISISDAATVKLNGKSYYVFKCPVAAKEMTATITAQVYVGDEAKGNPYTYTVRDYATYLLNHTADNAAYAKAAPLVKAMLNYGASAQTLFGNNTDSLANKDVEYTGGLSAEEVKTAVKTVVDSASLTDLSTTTIADGLTFEGASLNLGSSTAYTLHYKITGNVTPPAITSQTDGITVSMKKQNGMILYYIHNIEAGHLLDNINIKIGDTSLIVNPASFMYAALKADVTQYNNLQDTVVALYNFDKEAKNYQ